MSNLFSSESNAFKSLDGKDFKDEYSKSKEPVLIDVRTALEFGFGSIKNAINIDVLAVDFNNQVSALSKEKDYFLFCRTGNRSGHACNMMAQQGFKVYNLKGGVDAWPR